MNYFFFFLLVSLSRNIKKEKKKKVQTADLILVPACDYSEYISFRVMTFSSGGIAEGGRDTKGRKEINVKLSDAPKAGNYKGRDGQSATSCPEVTNEALISLPDQDNKYFQC